VSDAVTLLINGTAFGGWTSVRITRSIKQICDTFSLTLSERWSGAVGSDTPPQISAGDPCQVYCGDELVITGYVDDTLPSYDAQQHVISVQGRSKPADLVDCGHAGKQWTQPRTLLQLARELAWDFGITVRADTDVGAAFQRPAIAAGQTRFEFLEKLARQRGVRLISDSDGTLVIARTGTVVVPDALELGKNIRSSSGRFSVRDRFGEIVVVGQTAGTDTWNGTAAASIRGSATDTDVRRARRHVLVAENAADAAACRKRAEWQRNTNYGNGEALTYTVSGWRHSSGLWLPNTRVSVTDKWMRLDNRELLIPAVQYILDKEGRRTELQLMPHEAFDLVALPEKQAVQAWN